jgi:putative tricarboxylic transport membrane protein
LFFSKFHFQGEFGDRGEVVDFFSNLGNGFSLVLQPINFLYCFAGVFLGTLIGVLPGIGPVGTMCMLFPLLIVSSPLAGIMVMAGVYYGAMYGGSTTSILVNIPGEAASVVTCLDGYQMAKQGRAGPALGICAMGSFIGGTISVVLLSLLSIPLAKIALDLGPAEYSGLMTMGLALTIYLSGESLLKGGIMAVFGLLLGCVGTDLVTGKVRFAYGFDVLYDGLSMAPMAMGLFGIAEVLQNLSQPEERVIFETRVRNLLPNLQDWKRSACPIARGSILGFFLGLIPGGGGLLSSFISYAVEKKISKHPEEFGHGAIEGVAGPETANNAAVAGAFIPLFALGIPSNVVMAVLLTAFVIYGVAPGPRFMASNPELFWGIVASMYIGNVMLLLLNLPLIRIWVKLLEIPYKILFPLILIICAVGVYSIDYRSFDILLMVAFGIIGYVLRRHDYPLAPIIFAFVLGPLLEDSFRQCTIIGSEDLSYFWGRPIALVAFAIAIFIFISGIFSSVLRFRKKVIEDGGFGKD